MNELLKLVRAAFIGIPDAGKSTLISALIKHLYNKNIHPDTLMNEVQYNKDGKDIYGNADTRTIRAAKILMPYKDYELMLIDCPGHIEYLEQIKQGIDMCSIVICLIDENRINESKDYINELNNHLHFIDNKHITYIYTHASENTSNRFEYNLPNNGIALNELLNYIESNNEVKVDIEEEALHIITNELPNFKNKCIMFSGGKDSIVGNDLCKRCNQSLDIIFPKSGFDFTELEAFIDTYYNDAITKSNLPDDMNYNNSTVFEIHTAKGAFNKALEKQYDLMCINYRASDEGVRSKDHYIKMGESCMRFSPVFYFSEENIWRYIRKYSLPFTSIYLNGYRSLGDEPVTIPSMPKCHDINEIIDYIHKHPFEERDGRKAQDNSTEFGMEKLRNNGFF